MATASLEDDDRARQLPFVSLIFPCVDIAGGLDESTNDLLDLKWETKEPLTVVQLPLGGVFPYLVERLYVYVHVTDGYGEFDLRVEMYQILGSERVDPDGGIPGERVRRWRGPTETVRLSEGNKLIPIDLPFECDDVPFQVAGLYEFAVLANEAPLAGNKGILKVLDRRIRL